MTDRTHSQSPGAAIAVLGAGIIGLAAAHALRRQGYRVRVVHAAPIDDSTSCGNAGAIAAAEIAPFLGLELIAKAPKWLLDPLGPLHLRFSYLPAMLPWLRRFAMAGTCAGVAASTRAMAALLAPALDDHRTMLAAAGLDGLLREQGGLFVYRTEAAMRAAAAAWQARRDHGIRVEEFDRAAIEAREPALGPAAHCGYFTPDWAHVTDPRAVVVGLAEFLKSDGVEFQAASVADIIFDGGRAVALATAQGERIAFDGLVVAAGAWSAALSAKLGDACPLESERGYNATLPDPGVKVRSFVTFAEDHFVMTPMRMGLRIGGAVEFAGLDAPPNYARSDALVRLAGRYLPGLRTAGATRWMGHRPSTPDAMPVIGASPGHANVCYAFGHGHLGLTAAATTGRIVGAIICGRAEDSGLDLRPYRVERFR